jgi:hypothetical protein
MDLGDPCNVANAVGSVGITFLKQRRFSEADAVLSTAATLAQRQDMPYVLTELLYYQAELAQRAQSVDLALHLNRECTEIAHDIGDREYEALGHIQRLILQRNFGQITAGYAESEFGTLLKEVTDKRLRAILFFELSKTDSSNAILRQQAIDTLRAEYEASGRLEMRDMYEALTGQELAQQIELPGLPPAIANTSVSLDKLLERAQSRL